MAVWILSRTTQVIRYQKVKTKANMDFVEQESERSGIIWAVCKYAHR